MRMYRLQIYLRYPNTINYYKWDTLTIQGITRECRFFNNYWGDGCDRAKVSEAFSVIEDVINGLTAESALLLYVHNDCGSTHISFLTNKLLKEGRESVYFLYERYSSLPNPAIDENYPNIHSIVKEGETINGFKKKVDYAQTYYEHLPGRL